MQTLIVGDGVFQRVLITAFRWPGRGGGTGRKFTAFFLCGGCYIGPLLFRTDSQFMQGFDAIAQRSARIILDIAFNGALVVVDEQP
ncbi:hypothetical protein OS42_42900 [Dickeya oryzae]